MNIIRNCAIALGLVLGLQGGHAGPAIATTLTGHIVATNTATSANLGYVNGTLNVFGEFDLTGSLANSLTVSFSDGSTPFSIATPNGPDASFPFFGAVRGFAATSNDLGVGSYNYAYLAGTVSGTATGQNTFTNKTGISELSQSLIWSRGPGNQLTAQWVNSDTSIVATTIMFLQGTFVLVGDVATFQTHFGSATPVTLTFVAQTPLPGALPLFAVGLVAMPLLGWRRKRATAMLKSVAAG